MQGHYTGPRMDRKAVEKIAERMSKPRGAKAAADAKRRAAKLCLVHPSERNKGYSIPQGVERAKEDCVSADRPYISKKLDLKHICRDRLSVPGRWEHGPDGQPIFVSNEGWDEPTAQDKRSVVAIEGRIHNTPVGSAIATPRSDSPFKRAKAAASKVVIVRKGK